MERVETAIPISKDFEGVDQYAVLVSYQSALQKAFDVAREQSAVNLSNFIGEQSEGCSE